MKRRNFIKKAGLLTASAFAAPYILPSGRLFAKTGQRIANHVVFVVFGGGIRNQESVHQLYLDTQNGQTATGNLMPNLLSGAEPSRDILYNKITHQLTNPLQTEGVLFKEMRYADGPTGHYNGHAVAITGKYTTTGVNLNVNPEAPTIFEYYRKHNSPQMSALNAWWISNSLGPYPSLNFSQDRNYGPLYGANFMSPTTTFGLNSFDNLHTTAKFHPEEKGKIDALKGFLDNNFKQSVEALKGIQNSEADREHLKTFINDTLQRTYNGQINFPLPANQINGDLVNVVYAGEVMKEFNPELLVVNLTDSDVCHDNFTGYVRNLHQADFCVGYLWDLIQNTPGMANDTILIAMPEHGRNLMPNTVSDNNGLLAFDHTSDQNSREIFALMVGPQTKNNVVFEFDAMNNPIGESIDVVPTIAHILGFYDDIPSGYLNGRILREAFI